MNIARLIALALLASASLAAGNAIADNGAAPGNKAGSAGYAGSTPSNDETSKPNNADTYKARCHGLKGAERQHCLDDEKDARKREKDAARVERDAQR